MKIVHAASEMFPLVKTGGLADVTGALSKFLSGFGHEISFFLPGYRSLLESPEFDKAKLKVVLQIELGDEFLRGEVYSINLGKRQTLYLIRRDEFFDRSFPYGTNGHDYDDNDRRFIYFCKAIVESMRLLEIKADILHCHDWQTGLTPLFLRMEEQNTGISLALRTFFTIHNLAFQGLFPGRSFHYTNLPSEFNEPDGIEFYEQVSMIKAGIIFADKVMTVSPNYAREILTPRFGCGLEGVLKDRQEDLVGVVNGIDSDVWNPVTDPVLPRNFSVGDMKGKDDCRRALLESVNMPATDMPVYGMVCRFTEQKGIDLLIRQLPFFVKHNCRLLVLGTKAPEYERVFKRWEKSHPDHFSVRIMLNESISHLIEAGSDFFLMPSVFEPCGLNQMYSLRYGTIPIGSNVGGLVDTVIDVDAHPADGTGISFEPDDEAFEKALQRSLELYADKEAFAAVRERAMKQDFSWKRVAKQYEALYADSI